MINQISQYIKYESFWINLSFLLFVIFAYKPLKNKLCAALDKKREIISHRIDAALLNRQKEQSGIQEAEQNHAESIVHNRQIEAEAKTSAQQMIDAAKSKVDEIRKRGQETITLHKAHIQKDMTTAFKKEAIKSASTALATKFNKADNTIHDTLVDNAILAAENISWK